jgi:hypothetical protein
MSAAQIKEHLLQTWINHKPIDPVHKNCHDYGLTAEFNGVKFYTRPKPVMDRKHAFEPYKEVPGVGWFFLNDRDELVKGFSGEPNGSTLQGSFEDVARFVPELIQADWAYTKKPI